MVDNCTASALSTTVRNLVETTTFVWSYFLMKYGTEVHCLYMFDCMCACVRALACVCVCVCVCVHVCVRWGAFICMRVTYITASHMLGFSPDVNVATSAIVCLPIIKKAPF